MNGICNKQIEPRFYQVINEIKQQKEKELSFLQELDIKIDKETTEVFQIPKYDPPKIIEPTVQDSRITAKSVRIPTVSNEFFNDVCSVINKVFRSVEKKPSIYEGKTEEELRDYVLPMLETRYSGVSATGETFNKSGKTDILVRHTDGSNVFIAECKYWHGVKKSRDAISQLFDKYITWRDTKVALIYFVKEKEFSEILKKIDRSVKDHGYFIESIAQIDETTMEYRFHVPGDRYKHVEMRTLAFSFAGT